MGDPAGALEMLALRVICSPVGTTVVLGETLTRSGSGVGVASGAGVAVAVGSDVGSSVGLGVGVGSGVGVGVAVGSGAGSTSKVLVTGPPQPAVLQACTRTAHLP